ELLFSGATASGAIVQGGGQIVSSGAVASGAVLSNGGFQSVLSSGSVTGTIVDNGGDEIIYSGGIVAPATLNLGGEVALVGAKANGANLDGSGNLQVTSDGVVIDTIDLTGASSDAFGFAV